MTWLWIGIGGFVGANARYLLTIHARDRLGAAFPWGTFIVNLTGSLAIGFILIFLAERSITNPAWRLMAVVGFLGGYTTFSSYTFEGVALMEQGQWLRAMVYIIGSSLLGLLACFAGMTLARSLA